ncbi:hypothetical protein ABH945_003251 [Paraburkholderia sp. GAS333]|uniref:hypothetical protein n=1 Tax=Paraburkholderia sp. GAS333 TaxID=3156279 RepID=UPI003D203FEE
MKTVLTVIAWLGLMLVADTALAQACPGISNSQCRATPPSGKLLHNKNSKGFPIWTTDCNQPNSAGHELDPLCHQIASCSASGAFGKFLQSVTFDCKGKHFEGYFGLDGMTFGILDWTQDNLPRVLKAYQLRNGERYRELFGNLDIPTKNGCVDERWVCESNRQARLTCDPTFHSAFAESLREPDFKKAQIDVALDAYEGRRGASSRRLAADV